MSSAPPQSKAIVNNHVHEVQASLILRPKRMEVTMSDVKGTTHSPFERGTLQLLGWELLLQSRVGAHSGSIVGFCSEIPPFISHTKPTPPDQSDRLHLPHDPSVVGSIPTGWAYLSRVDVLTTAATWPQCRRTI